MQSFEINLRYLLATSLFSLISGESAYTYKDAENWGKHYPKCNGKYQSPAVMKYPEFNFPPIKEDLKFTDFQKLPRNMTLTNTGHTVEIKADWSGEPPKVTGGPLHGTYVFEKTIFRWAQEQWMEYDTSEDWDKDGISSDMQMHLYFYKADLKSFEKAESQKDGLAIFRVMVKSTPYCHELPEHLDKSIHKVQSIHSTTVIPPFPITRFVDQGFTFNFLKGSLDYPPCSETVTWFTLKERLMTIPKNLLNAFRKIKLEGGDVSNVRPAQPLNKRQIKNVASGYPRNDFP